MDIQITNEKENPLLYRKEISFNISHADATPSRNDVKSKLVALLNSQFELVYIDRLTTEYGTQNTTGYAKVYDDIEMANKIEKKHIIERNKPRPVKEEAPDEEATGEEAAEEAGADEESAAEKSAAEETSDKSVPEESSDAEAETTEE